MLCPAVLLWLGPAPGSGALVLSPCPPMCQNCHVAAAPAASYNDIPSTCCCPLLAGSHAGSFLDRVSRMSQTVGMYHVDTGGAGGKGLGYGLSPASMGLFRYLLLLLLASVTVETHRAGQSSLLPKKWHVTGIKMIGPGGMGLCWLQGSPMRQCR